MPLEEAFKLQVRRLSVIASRVDSLHGWLKKEGKGGEEQKEKNRVKNVKSTLSTYSGGGGGGGFLTVYDVLGPPIPFPLHVLK